MESVQLVGVQDPGVRTYRIAAIFTPAAAATDIATLTGATNYKIKPIRALISGVATAAAVVDLLTIKRTTANSGGTATTPAPVPESLRDHFEPARGVASFYTANPTTGATTNGGGTMRADKFVLGAVGTPTVPDRLVMDFDLRAQRIELRSPSDVLALNFSGGTFAGNSVAVTFVWTEEMVSGFDV